MEYWGNSEAFVGSAGILPAAAGMLPVAIASCFHVARSVALNAVRQNAGQSGQHARAPRNHVRFTRSNIEKQNHDDKNSTGWFSIARRAIWISSNGIV